MLIPYGYTNKNADALPNTLQYRLGQQTLLQNNLATAESDIARNKDQKQQMIALFNATGQITGTTANQTPEARQLDQLVAGIGRQVEDDGLDRIARPARHGILTLQPHIERAADVTLGARRKARKFAHFRD